MTDNENQLGSYDAYRARVGEPTTHDEVRDYRVFLIGLVVGMVGIRLFIPPRGRRVSPIRRQVPSWRRWGS
jgi:hypothetical protein